MVCHFISSRVFVLFVCNKNENYLLPGSRFSQQLLNLGGRGGGGQGSHSMSGVCFVALLN